MKAEQNTNTALFQEGHARIYTKYTHKNNQGQTLESQVFYNPVQVFNRDLSVLAIQTYIDTIKKEQGQKFQGATIADALSASGLRTIRYLRQITGVKQVIANDLLPAAHKLMQDNFDLNKLKPESYSLSLQDANVLLREAFKQYGGFDVVDLDPYGSVVPFLDASMAAAKQGGLLCITCTDTRVLCGPDLSKCYYFYGTVRAKVQDFNENALRILLSCVSSAASRHCKYIQPLLSLQTDFYVRVFVRVRAGKRECGQSGSKIGNIYNCQFCGNYQSKAYFKPKDNHFVPQRQVCSRTHCDICGHPFQLNGPVWLDPINDPAFVQSMQEVLDREKDPLPLATAKKIKGVLHGILAQKENAKIPLSFNLDLACKNVHSTGLGKQSLFNAVKSLGEEHTLTPSYLSPGHYKTSLPLKAIYDIIKAWKLKELGEEKYLSNVKNDRAVHILKGESSFKPDFEFKTDEKQKKVPRFISLGKGLGPKGKAGKRVIQENGEKIEQEVVEKVQNRQGRKKSKAE